MWKRLKDELSYFILFTKDQNYNISVTNYIQIWNVVYTEEEFISWLKDNNFALEIDSYELVANSTEMLLEPAKLKSADVSCEHNQLEVAIARNFGYPLKLTMILQQGSHDMFYKMVTKSLLKTIQDLKCSETELRDLLKCKDKEIEEYKAEAGEVVLRYLKTKPFNDTAHMEKHTAYEANFGNSDVPVSLVEETNSSQEESFKSMPVKQENVAKVEIKSEPNSQVLQMEMQVMSNEVHIKTEIKAESSITPKKRKIRLNL